MTTTSAEHTQSDATFRIRVTDRTRLALIMALHALVGALVFRFGTDLQDEGLISVWARRLLEGQLPYTDFYMNQAPGTFYLNALLVKLFGVSLLAGRVFKQVESLLVIWLAYHVVTRATQQTRAGVVAALATATFSAAHHFRFPWYGTDACIFLLAGAWLGCVAIDTGRLRWVFAAGAAVGCALLIKQNHAVFVLPCIGLVLAWHGFRRELDASVGTRALTVARALSILFLGFIAPLTAYLAYYVSAGGSLALLWQNTIVWSSEAKDFPSAADLLLAPLRAFTLIHKGSWHYPIAGLALTIGVVLALARRGGWLTRGIGAALIAASAMSGPDLFVRGFVWSFGSCLVLSIFVASVLEAVRAERTRSDQVDKALLVAAIAASNLYGGTVPGGGWGRLVETLPATLPILGIASFLLTREGGAVAAGWARHSWVTPRQAGLALVTAALVMSAGLLIKNQAFRPKLDVELAAMRATPSTPGWRGLLGDALYVTETDELLTQLRALSQAERHSVYVFPLNAAIYPLADVRNPTRFDSHQNDFLAPSRFPDVLDELHRTKPAMIVMQVKNNQSFGPDSDATDGWVRTELRDAVAGFVRTEYELVRRWRYYELFRARR